MDCAIVWGGKSLLEQMCLRVGGKKKPVRGRLSVSSVAGDVFCLVTAGTAIGQSDQHVRFEWGGPSCLLLSHSGFLLLYFIRGSYSHSCTHRYAHKFTPTCMCIQIRIHSKKHIHFHCFVFTYAGKFQTSFVFLYPLCTTCLHCRWSFISRIVCFSQDFHQRFVCFYVVVFHVTWCHCERTRAARRQVNSNWSKCTCGLSSSQSLGKYPINNPVTTTPVTPTHIHTIHLYGCACTHKTYEMERLLLLCCCHL